MITPAMLKKLIGLFIIILLFAIAVNAQSQRPSPSVRILSNQEKPESDKHKNDSPQNQRGTDQWPLFIKMVPSPNAKDEAAQAKKDKEEQMAANRRAEITTYFIAGATTIQAIALIITIIVMIWVAIRQLRAYVFVDTIDMFNIIPPPPKIEIPPGAWVYQPNSGPLAFIVIKNSGNTPAHGVLNWGEIYFKEFPLTSDLPYGDRNAPGLIKTKFDMPPGGKTSKAIRIAQPLSDNEVAQLRSGTHAIYVYGDIIYKDVFYRKRSTSFRFFINGIIGFTHLSNTMSGYGEGNEAN